MPCGVALAGANVHDSRLVTPTVEGRVAAASAPTEEEEPRHLCLDKAYGMKRVEAEVQRECRTVDSETCPNRFQLPPRHYFALRAGLRRPRSTRSPAGFIVRR